VKTIDEAVFVFDSPDDRLLLAKEAEADPSFARRLRVTLSMPDGEKRVTMSARRAIVNELNPALYPESRGLWKQLRKVTRDLIGYVSSSVRGDLGAPIRKEAISRIQGLGDLGQWEILGQVVGAVVQAGASVYTSYNQAQTARSIQQMQIDAQLRQIQAAENIAKANQAMTAAQAQQAPVQTAVANVVDTISTPIMGVPLWAVAIGLYFLAEKA
jgi:hypothetical protein